MIFTEKQVIIDNSKDLKTQENVFEKLSHIAFEIGITTNKNAYKKALLKREKESTTGFENGFAIPHGISKKIEKPALFFIRADHGIEWRSMDGKPTKYIFALAIPQKDVESKHIDILSKIAVSIMKDEFQNRIKSASTIRDLFNAINEKIK